MSQQNGPKLMYINNLRVLLIIMIVLIHIAITYGASGSWYYHEQNSDLITGVLLTLYCAIAQSFTLGFFFMISGYFTPGSYSRKGPGEFFRDRLVRLGIPFLVYYFLINPFITYTLYVKLMGGKVSAQNLFSSGPLWFVEALLIFSIGYHLFGRGDRGDGRKLAAPQGISLLKYAVLLSFVNFIVRLLFPVGTGFSNLQFAFFPGYIGFFAVGVIAYRNNWFDTFSEIVGMRWLKISGAGILLFPVLMVMGGAVDDVTPFMGGLHWQSIIYSTWDAFVGTGLIAGLFVIFRRRYNKQGRTAKILADNTYTVYIIHAPIVIFLSYAIREIHLYPLLKFALAAVIEVSICFAVSHFIIRRIPFTEKVL